MVVQVTPDGWSARCVEHGVTTPSTWDTGFGNKQPVPPPEP
jgi:hypothetical protein